MRPDHPLEHAGQVATRGDVDVVQAERAERGIVIAQEGQRRIVGLEDPVRRALDEEDRVGTLAHDGTVESFPVDGRNGVDGHDPSIVVKTRGSLAALRSGASR